MDWLIHSYLVIKRLTHYQTGLMMQNHSQIRNWLTDSHWRRDFEISIPKRLHLHFPKLNRLHYLTLMPTTRDLNSPRKILIRWHYPMQKDSAILRQRLILKLKRMMMDFGLQTRILRHSHFPKN